MRESYSQKYSGTFFPGHGVYISLFRTHIKLTWTIVQQTAYTQTNCEILKKTYKVIKNQIKHSST